MGGRVLEFGWTGGEQHCPLENGGMAEDLGVWGSWRLLRATQGWGAFGAGYPDVGC